jgi:hypothetical protein
VILDVPAEAAPADVSAAILASSPSLAAIFLILFA